jgi:hypothetical protein
MTTIARAHEYAKTYPDAPAGTRLRWARTEDKRTDTEREWVDAIASDIGTGRATILEIAGTTVTIRVERDLNPDLSYAGEFSHKWEPGAVPRLPEVGPPLAGYTQHNPSELPDWFVPSGLDGLEDYYRKAGMSRGRIQERITEAVRSQQWVVASGESYVADVTVYYAGAEVGASSIGGLDPDPRDTPTARARYIAESIVWDCDLIGEALASAADTVERIASARDDDLLATWRDQ